MARVNKKDILVFSPTSLTFSLIQSMEAGEN